MSGREEGTKPNIISKMHAQDEISPTFRVDGEPLPLRNYSQRIQTHMVIKVKSAKTRQFKPQPGNIIQTPRKP
jgi:hypothetical protein